MNMMSLQERREEQAVPDFVRQIRMEESFDHNDEAEAAHPTAPRATMLERIDWFRDLSLSGKINAIFGTFLATGVLMVLVLGAGLGELWNRYNASAQVQETLVAAGQLQSYAGELRYHSVRVLYDRSPDLREQQRKGESALLSQVTAIEAALAKDAPELAPRVVTLREVLAEVLQGEALAVDHKLVYEFGWREFFRFTERAFKVVFTLWMIPLGLFAYMVYLYHLTGDALAFKHIQVAWGRYMDSPLDWWLSGFELGGRKAYLSIMVIFGWCLNGYLFSQKRWAEATLMFICCTIPLMTGLNAMPRYMFGLYPTLLAIILLTHRWPAIRPAVLCISGMVASFIAVAFVNFKFFTVGRTIPRRRTAPPEHAGPSTGIFYGAALRAAGRPSAFPRGGCIARWPWPCPKPSRPCWCQTKWPGRCPEKRQTARGSESVRPHPQSRR